MGALTRKAGSVHNRSLIHLLSALSLFAVAFGYVEGAVVVYLRYIAYPEGFQFPLLPMPTRLLLTEVGREAATLFLLLGVSFAAERLPYRRFAVFSLCFGVWDLAYYATLKGILGWPSGWLEWDVLFLIPAAWTGPVLAPVLVSVGLIAAGMLLLSLPPPATSPLRARDWGIESVAGLLIVLAFLWNVPLMAENGVPKHFPWWLFGVGYLGGTGWFAWRWVSRSRENPTGITGSHSMSRTIQG